MDYESLASELLRALRGKRSQAALSKRLGYHSNVVYTWESKNGYPTAARALTVARRVGIEPADAVRRFYRRPPAWVDQVNLATPEGVVRLLSDLRGTASIKQIAHAAGRDRYAVSRWLKGTAQPRLPDFLRLIEACSLRVLDFLAAFTDPEALPSARRHWRALQTARQTAFDAPWSHAVLHALELSDYKKLPQHRPGWIAERVGISAEEERRCLALLAKAGQICFRKRRWQPRQVGTIDTRHEPQQARQLATWCSSRGTQLLAQGRGGNFAFNLFAVSERDLERLRQLQRDYFSQLRAIVADSKRPEYVAVANMQLFTLEASDEPPTAGPNATSHGAALPAPD